MLNGKDIVEILLQNEKTDPNIQDNSGNTALFIAAKEGNKEIIKILLLDKRVIVNMPDENVNTPLDHAIIIEIANKREFDLRKTKRYTTNRSP